MSVEKTEVETYFGRCRCCLAYGYLKNMWLEQEFKGVTEIYGEMLVECFALSWDQSEGTMEQDQICEQCICRLRDANDFKKTVLDSQEEILQQTDGDNEVTVKTEALDAEFLYEAETADTEFIEYNADTNNTGNTTDNVKDEMNYEEIEYLEEEDGDPKEVVDTDSSLPTENQTERRVVKRRKVPQSQDSDIDEGPKRKWPKKLPKSERFKTYKQYTEEDLRECMEAVRSGELTASEAAVKFNIPKKTISAKAKMDPKDDTDSNKERTFQLLKEIKSILTYTNATPYKSKHIRYYCAYCSTDGPHFEDPDDLRNHTRSAHVAHRIEKIEYAMRPYWMNEVLKLDIHNLLCTVCCVVINNWNEMFKHLKNKHNVVLDQAYNRVIPYNLTSDLQCALCKESYTNYLHLDGHMNAHYNNYVCGNCGDTFLAQNRLKQHLKIHDVGKYPCSMCDKVFTLQKYKRKHEESVHQQLLKFKCLHCDEKFTGEYVRHAHCLEKHKDKVKIITCETCGKTFTWKQYYLNHLRKTHKKQKTFQCPQCDKKFFNHYELKDHLLRHTGTRNFECPICHKKYVSLTSLKHHGRQHRNKNEDSSTQKEYIVIDT